MNSSTGCREGRGGRESATEGQSPLGNREEDQGTRTKTESQQQRIGHPGRRIQEPPEKTESQQQRVSHPLKAVYLRIYVSMYVCIYLSTYLPIYPSIHLPIYPSIYLSCFILSTKESMGTWKNGTSTTKSPSGRNPKETP